MQSGNLGVHPTEDVMVSQQESEQAITVQRLVKRYGDFVAVNDVSFSIQHGEIFGIIGPNGAGKTTAVECISGLRTPDSGSISIQGLSPLKDRDKIREFLGVQLQESSMPPRLKVGEAVKLFASFYPNPMDPDGLLETLGIERKVAYVTVIGTGDLAASVIDSLARIGVHVSDIEARGGNLDDAFVKLTRDDTSRVQERLQS